MRRVERIVQVWVVLGAAVCAQTPAVPEEADASSEARARFSAMDRDDDGFLTAEELGRPRLFALLDADGDGLIGVDEAVALADRRRAPEAGEPSTAPDDQAPRPSETPGLRVTRDIVYATREDSDANLTSLDITAPATGAGYPILVMIHGGGWRIGDKSNPGIASPKAEYFAGRGFVYVAINYRLSPAVVHPAHIEDVAAALAWVHDHAREYGGDPERLAIMGHSAGAHLAALVGADSRWLAAHDKSLGILDAVILLDGAGYDIAAHFAELPQVGALRDMYEGAFGTDASRWKDASPTLQVAAGRQTPPFQIFYVAARVDSAFQSRGLARALTAAGVAVELVPAPDKNHMTLNRDIGQGDDWVTQRIDAFLAPLTAPATAPR